MGKKKLFRDQYIVVTGGAGFIGSCIIRQLNEQGYENIVVVDDFHESIKWKNLIGKRYVEFLSRHELFDWLHKRGSDVEAVVHMGACSSTVMIDGDMYYEKNYRYSIKLAEFALEHGLRFVYASSAATYGMGHEGFSDDPKLIDTLRPLNMYAQSKQMFDQWILRHGLISSVLGLKFFNVYGPNEYHKERMASMVLHMCNQVRETGKVKLFKSNTPTYQDGEQVRDFIYVKDVARYVCEFLQNDLMGIYNLGSGVTSSWNDLARAVFKAMNIEPNIEYIPMPESLAPNYQNYTCADMTRFHEQRAKAKLETATFSSLENGVGEYVRDYLLNGNRW